MLMFFRLCIMKVERGVVHMSTRKVGQFEFEFVDAPGFEALPFIPFFQRYIMTASDENEELIKSMEDVKKKLDKKPEDEGLLLQLENLQTVYEKEAQTRMMNFFLRVSDYEWAEIQKFMVKMLKKWNMQEKGKKLPITLENVKKIPRVFMPHVLDALAVHLLLDSGAEINFSTEEFENSDKILN